MNHLLKKKTRSEKEIEKLKNPIGKRVWFNLRMNRNEKVGFGLHKHVLFQKMRNAIGGREFGEGIIVQTDEKKWTIRVVAPQRNDKTGEEVTITMNKGKSQSIPPGISWY